MPNRKLPPNNILQSLYEEGMGPTEISKLLNANINTVSSALLRIKGLKKRSVSESQKLAFSRGRKVVKFWEGKKQPPEMIENRVSKIRGEKHYLWKGGKSCRPHRDLIKKYKCDECNGRLNLGIHHKDLDYFNNNPKNLQVLCVSCHITLHKKLYWKAKREGTEYKTNSPIGWNK